MSELGTVSSFSQASYVFDKKSKINEYVDMKKLYEITENENIDNYLSKFLFSVLNTKTFLVLFD